MKIAVFILSFYVLFCTVVPCSFYDGCDDTGQAESTPDQDHEKDCDGCSPFSACSTTHVCPVISPITSPQPVEVYYSRQYSEFSCGTVSAYAFTLFQPPRIG